MKSTINFRRNKEQKLHSNHSLNAISANYNFEPITLKEKGKNINVYRHLMLNNDPGCLDKAGMNWILELRQKVIEDDKPKPSLKKTSSQPPKFYEEDFGKVIQKMRKERERQKKEKNESIKQNKNLSNIRHLAKSNIDYSQYSFSTQLRTFKKSDIHNRLAKVREWKDQPYEKISCSYHTTMSTFCLPPTKQNDRNTMKRIEKFTLRPYETVYDKGSVGSTYVKRKKLKKSSVYSLDWYGDHLSLLPYNDNYRGANIENNVDLINNKKQTNSQLLFSLRLRLMEKEKEGNLIKKSAQQRKRSLSNNNTLQNASMRV